jgi:hypothetical protein
MQAMPGNTHQPEIFPPYFEYINYSNRNNMKQPCELGCTQIDPYIYISREFADFNFTKGRGKHWLGVCESGWHLPSSGTFDNKFHQVSS